MEEEQPKMSGQGVYSNGSSDAPETARGALSGPTGGLASPLDILRRAARHAPLTPNERAALRALTGLWQTALAAGVAAVLQAAVAQTGAPLSWAALTQTGEAALIGALLAGAVKLITASGDPLLVPVGEALATPGAQAALTHAINGAVNGALDGARGQPGWQPGWQMSGAGDVGWTSGWRGGVAGWDDEADRDEDDDAGAPPEEPVWDEDAGAGLADTQPALPVVTLEPTLPAPQPPAPGPVQAPHADESVVTPTLQQARVVAQVASLSAPAEPPVEAVEAETTETAETVDAHLAELEARVEQARAALAEALRRAHPGMSQAETKAESWAR